MHLKDRARQGLEEKRGRLDIDSFGEIMDRFIGESCCGLVVYKEEGEDEFHVKGAGCGAVIDFYIFLNAAGPIFERMLEEMGGRDKVEVETLAHALCAELEKSLLESAKEDKADREETEG